MIILKQIFMFLFVCILSSSCSASNETNNKCDDWIANAVEAIESIPPAERFKMSLFQIKQACDEGIPESLKQAATKGLTASINQRQIILQQAAKSYFSESCLDTKATQPANNLTHICLGDDFVDGRYSSILPNIDAASYMYGKALEKELENSGLNNQFIKKLMLNYFLGAAFDFESRSK